MININRVIAALLVATTACADLTPRLPAQPPTPPAAEPNAKASPIAADKQTLFSGDKITEKMFPDGVSHDFGKVQRGTLVYHEFRIVNTSNRPLRIAWVRVAMSAGTTRVGATKKILQPNEEGTIELTLDTRSFIHFKTLTAYLLFDQPRYMEHRIWFSVDSRENLAFFPDNLDFGTIRPGETPTKRMIVAVPDQPKLQVTGATCNSEFIQVKVQEVGRGKTTAVYQVSATVRADIPDEALYATVELSTNNPAMPKLFVPVRVKVEPMK